MIEKTKVKERLAEIEALVEKYVKVLPQKARKKVKDTLFKQIKEGLEPILTSRPPRIYVVGRRGHGKSSVINALAGQKVAETSIAKPSRPKTEAHLVSGRDCLGAHRGTLGLGLNARNPGVHLLFKGAMRNEVPSRLCTPPSGSAEF